MKGAPGMPPALYPARPRPCSLFRSAFEWPWVLIEFSFTLNIHSVNSIINDGEGSTNRSVVFEKAHMKDGYKKTTLGCRLGSVRTVIPTVPPTTGAKDRTQVSPPNAPVRPNHQSTVENAGPSAPQEGNL